MNEIDKKCLNIDDSLVVFVLPNKKKNDKLSIHFKDKCKKNG